VPASQTAAVVAAQFAPGEAAPAPAPAMTAAIATAPPAAAAPSPAAAPAPAAPRPTELNALGLMWTVFKGWLAGLFGRR
jgi:hypothetical protein